MKVLMVEPGKVPYETEIEGGLESLQKAVGGSIQAVYPYDDPVALICNEEGKLMGLDVYKRQGISNVGKCLRGQYIRPADPAAYSDSLVCHLGCGRSYTERCV